MILFSEASHFVGGHKHDDESFRQCVIGAGSEEWEIHRAIGLMVAEQPLGHLHYTAWPDSAGLFKGIESRLDVSGGLSK